MFSSLFLVHLCSQAPHFWALTFCSSLCSLGVLGALSHALSFLLESCCFLFLLLPSAPRATDIPYVSSRGPSPFSSFQPPSHFLFLRSVTSQVAQESRSWTCAHSAVLPGQAFIITSGFLSVGGTSCVEMGALARSLDARHWTQVKCEGPNRRADLEGNF